MSRFGQRGGIFNHGATISAHDGDILIRASDFENITGAVGRIEVLRRCGLICRTTTSGSEILTYGATIDASGELIVEADEVARNIGGVLAADKAVTIRADLVEAIALHVPVIVHRPRGLYSFWNSRSAWLALRAQPGWMIARNGDILLETSRPARIEGDSLEAGGDMMLSAGREELQAPDHPVIAPQAPGLLRWLPGI